MKPNKSQEKSIEIVIPDSIRELLEAYPGVVRTSSAVADQVLIWFSGRFVDKTGISLSGGALVVDLYSGNFAKDKWVGIDVANCSAVITPGQVIIEEKQGENTSTLILNLAPLT